MLLFFVVVLFLGRARGEGETQREGETEPKSYGESRLQ